MSTGLITWTLQDGRQINSYTNSSLTSGSWYFCVVAYGAKVELISSSAGGGGGGGSSVSWGRMKGTIKKRGDIIDAPNGYNSAVVAPTFNGGSGEHTIRVKFVSGNTILIGFAQSAHYKDDDLHNVTPTCFWRSNGSSIYENGASGSTKA